MPIGMLMKKIQCQCQLSVIHPPITGPSAGPTMTPMREYALRLALLFDAVGVAQDRLRRRDQPAAAQALDEAPEDELAEACSKGRTSARRS